MISLLLDSSASRLCVALARDNNVFVFVDEAAFQTQSEIMTERINKLVTESGLAFQDIGEIVVAYGPGSFTGVRIAVSISKVMAYALNIPLYKVSSLGCFKDEKRKTICVLDARKGRSFAALYEGNDVIVEDKIMNNEELLALAQNEGMTVNGETGHLGVTSGSFDRFNNMLSLRKNENKVEDVYAFKPRYLKG